LTKFIKLGNTEVTRDGLPFIIAEIGNNHQGSLDIARQMFRAAQDCGVQAVKLQKRNNKKLYTDKLYNSPYDNEFSFGSTYGAHREALEFGRDEYLELKQYGQGLGLVVFSTAFDFDSADFLQDIDFPLFKIASGDLKNLPFIKYVASFGKPVLLSTGGGSLEDVRRVYDTVMPINPNLIILQCTSSYPVEPRDMNLRVIKTYRKEFPNAIIGLSDHQSGIAMAMVGFTLGARVIEKHFTLNRAWKGTDQSFSLEPVGMKKLVRDLNRAYEALGDGIKRPLPVEEKPLAKMGKKLVAAANLSAGHVLSDRDIAIKSPGDGLAPYEIDNVIGKTLAKPLVTDENISYEILE
jgi:sialic acid synthase